MSRSRAYRRQAAQPYIAEVGEGKALKTEVPSPKVAGFEADQEVVAINISAVAKLGNIIPVT